MASYSFTELGINRNSFVYVSELKLCIFLVLVLSVEFEAKCFSLNTPKNMVVLGTMTITEVEVVLLFYTDSVYI